MTTTNVKETGERVRRGALCEREMGETKEAWSRIETEWSRGV